MRSAPSPPGRPPRISRPVRARSGWRAAARTRGPPAWSCPRRRSRASTPPRAPCAPASVFRGRRRHHRTDRGPRRRRARRRLGDRSRLRGGADRSTHEPDRADDPRAARAGGGRGRRGRLGARRRRHDCPDRSGNQPGPVRDRVRASAVASLAVGGGAAWVALPATAPLARPARSPARDAHGRRRGGGRRPVLRGRVALGGQPAPGDCDAHRSRKDQSRRTDRPARRGAARRRGRRTRPSGLP